MCRQTLQYIYIYIYVTAFKYNHKTKLCCYSLAIAFNAVWVLLWLRMPRSTTRKHLWPITTLQLHIADVDLVGHDHDIARPLTRQVYSQQSALSAFAYSLTARLLLGILYCSTFLYREYISAGMWCSRRVQFCQAFVLRKIMLYDMKYHSPSKY